MKGEGGVDLFCSKCGHKLPDGAEKCLNCGEPYSDSDMCGGFWELLDPEVRGDKRGKDPDGVIVLQNRLEGLEHQVKKDRGFVEKELKRFNTRSLVICLFCVMISICTCFIVARKAANDYQKIQEGITEKVRLLEEQVESLKMDMGEHLLAQDDLSQDINMGSLDTDVRGNDSYMEDTTEKDTELPAAQQLGGVISETKLKDTTYS